MIDLPATVRLRRQVRGLGPGRVHAILGEVSVGKDLPTVRILDHIKFLLETGDVEAARRTLQGRQTDETAEAMLLSVTSVRNALDGVRPELRRILDNEQARATRSTGAKTTDMTEVLMSQTTSHDPNQITHPGAAQSSAPNVDMARVRYGALLIGAAFVLLGVVFGIAVSQFSNAADVTAVVGSVSTVVGTIIGAFFGVQVGSSGKEAAEAGRNHAEQVTRMALAKLDPSAADEVVKAL